VFFPWLASFIAGLNTWLSDVETYIIAHAISGYSWRTTTTVLDPVVGHTTDAAFTVDEEFRPLVLNDLVSDESQATTYGEITALIDDTHATVTTLGKLVGLPGHGWWTTVTAISATGTTPVVLTAEAGRLPQVGDFVSDQSSALRYGEVTAVTDATHVTVTPLGVLRGLAGFGWWSTVTPIAHSGTTDVVLSSGPDRLPQVNDLVVDETTSSAYGEITAVADATHVTVAYVNTLQGPPGDTTGTVVSVVAGDGISVDATDPENPVVSATSLGSVESVVAGRNVHVDSTDPANPVVAVGVDGARFILPSVGSFPVADGVPGILNATGYAPIIYDGSTTWKFITTDVEASTGITITNPTPGKYVISVTGGAAVNSVTDNGLSIQIDNTDPANPIVTLPVLDDPLVNTVYSYPLVFVNTAGTWGLQDTVNTYPGQGPRGQYVSGFGNAFDADMGGGNTQGDSHIKAREFIALSSEVTTGTFAGDTAEIDIQGIGLQFNMIAAGGRGPGLGVPRYEAADLPNWGVNDVMAGAFAFNLTTGRPCFYDGVSAWTDL
jgi:hypothetical protein